MDESDRKILRFIQENGRSSYAEIGAVAGLSVSAVNERLKKLEKQGVIAQWGARLDPVAAGCGILAFVYVMIERPEHEAAFLTLVRDEPAILECHHVTGDWSYLLKVRAGSLKALEDLLARRIKALPGIPRSQTSIVLSSAKETAALPIPDTVG
ncbi:Lrp/AsnC family transcriptional regulator [uncultured Ferrovibrio sp.]|jgi:Lrp/AsnC family leucine-responsive transcriptional regulator|uniref:Lrp/AsnC family transcriptional regulator n=1 Tax=uncultured Ferrovibrio sp. TaxID=1576913 RepID=UPI00261CFE6F|nr:Lrp/AsnC family transcriptional regulator [uncultured Ferrovibrio sp.]